MRIEQERINAPRKHMSNHNKKDGRGRIPLLDPSGGRRKICQAAINEEREQIGFYAIFNMKEELRAKPIMCKHLLEKNLGNSI